MTFYTSKLRPYHTMISFPQHIVMLDKTSNKDFWYGYENGAMLIPKDVYIII